MAFNFKALFRFTRRLIAKIGDRNFPWTPRRAVVFLALFLVYPVLEVVIWFHLLVDDVFFRRYRQVKVREPVFIVGNFRSGTTFLHRLLARDRGRFVTMEMWEILFAPSISQRKVVGWLGALDRRLGGPLARRLGKLEDQWEEENPMHKAALTEPEEDDYLLLHIWSALTIGLSSGLLEEAASYVRFDGALPLHVRQRIMHFYFRCLQRHLYLRGGTGRQYLAKNPALTPKLHSVMDAVPQARFIILVRNPMQTVPSFVNMMNFSWRVLGGPVESEALRDFVVDMAGHWYRYPMQLLEDVPRDRFLFVRYDDLVADPRGTVLGIYRHFGFEPDEVYLRILDREAERASQYESRHPYSVAKVGLSAEEMAETFHDVIEHFCFGAPSSPNHAAAAGAGSTGREGREAA